MPPRGMPQEEIEKAVEVVEENRELFEKIVEAELPISEDFERVLNRVDDLKTRSND